MLERCCFFSLTWMFNFWQFFETSSCQKSFFSKPQPSAAGISEAGAEVKEFSVGRMRLKIGSTDRMIGHFKFWMPDATLEAMMKWLKRLFATMLRARGPGSNPSFSEHSFFISSLV